ncbi:MAG: hypothetical protein LV479_10270 [Methylacidiphilales bacterium]|nr:hypothetical protein [Candidatus Methylacidiphilales bacterium]
MGDLARGNFPREAKLKKLALQSRLLSLGPVGRFGKNCVFPPRLLTLRKNPVRDKFRHRIAQKMHPDRRRTMGEKLTFVHIVDRNYM